MRRLALCLALALAAAHPATAEDDALRAAVERYVANPVQQRMMDDMLSADAMVAQIRAVAPQLTEEQLQIAGRISAEELATLRPDLEAAMVEAAIMTFTLSEVEALDAFLATPEGASVMTKMQPYMAQAMNRVGPQMMALQARIGQRLATELSRP
ncbi:hypothetical protein HKCCSP123_04930 [Rhodobacterales bacterium HKCCSP123]|nr:hypothetical protein [Rhodobacterales bacterium HKCCSP123]